MVLEFGGGLHDVYNGAKLGYPKKLNMVGFGRISIWGEVLYFLIISYTYYFKEVNIMNKNITSKEQILNMSRELIKRKGFNSINIRTIADACNIAIGSIYNYFNSKEELTISIIGSIWLDIFHPSNICIQSDSFIEVIDIIFKSIEKGNKEYPNFFLMHSSILFGKNKTKAIGMMNNIKTHIREGLYKNLINDKNVRKDAFNESFTAEKFTDIVLSFIISAMSREDYDSSGIKEIIKRSIY